MILITGADGQLGCELVKVLNNTNLKFVAFNKSACNIVDEEQLFNIVTLIKPTTIIHCAAFTNVELAQKHQYLCWQINVIGTQNIQKIAQCFNIKVIFISTDYVFDGFLKQQYKEDFTKNPLNYYGLSKHVAEENIKQLERFYIIRTSWLFNKTHNNFVTKMIQLAEHSTSLTVVNDQFGKPTCAKSLSEFIVHIIRVDAPYGVYHFANQGKTNWYLFAKRILQRQDINVKPIKLEQFSSTNRPKNSVLCTKKAKSLNFDIPHWKKALENII